MKMLVHRVSGGSSQPFDLQSVKGYLRVSGSDDDVQIEGIALAAAAEIEHFAQIALITQTVRVTVFEPAPRESGLTLPIGPSQDGATVTVTIDGEAFTDFEFLGGSKPYICWGASWFELLPSRISIEYEAGFGTDFTAVPFDLAQALLDQAALLYDCRSPVDGKTSTVSPHMARIGARYRGVRA